MKLKGNGPQQTIERSEGKDLGMPNADSSYLVRSILTLRKKTLSEFTVEDIRIMVSQQEGLIYLIPLAVKELARDLFVEGDFFPGDLLKSVLQLNAKFWKENKDLWEQVDELIKHRLYEVAAHKISTEIFYSV